MMQESESFFFWRSIPLSSQIQNKVAEQPPEPIRACKEHAEGLLSKTLVMSHVTSRTLFHSVSWEQQFHQIETKEQSMTPVDHFDEGKKTHFRCMESVQTGWRDQRGFNWINASAYTSIQTPGQRSDWKCHCDISFWQVGPELKEHSVLSCS